MATAVTTIAAALAGARRNIDISEARLLLRHVLGRSAAHLEAHRDEPLDTASVDVFFSLVARRENGEPIAYLTQAREFYGRDFFVAPGVLIPRPETELIVDIVRGRFGRDSAPRILDLGTGSGCLAITLALELPRAAVTAIDVSPAALAIAAKNAALLGAKVGWIESDWFSALRQERFDAIVSNPPYIAAGDSHLTQGDLRFEPPGALASGSDGLDAIRNILAGAQSFLNPGGCLWFEHGYDQAAPVSTLLDAHGYAAIEQHRDIAGIIRVSGGSRVGTISR